MAGTYSTDLTTLSGDEVSGSANNSEITEFTNYTDGGGNSRIKGDPNLYVHGTNGLSTLGSTNANTSTSIGKDSLPAYSAVTNAAINLYAITPTAAGVANIDAAIPGESVIVGSAAGTYKAFRVSGKNVDKNGGFRQYLVDVTNSATYTTLNGFSSTTPSIVGCGWRLEADFRRSPIFGVDAIRYGRHTLTATNGDNTDVRTASSLESSAANFVQMEQYSEYNLGGTVPNAGTTLDSGYHLFGQLKFLAGSYLAKGILEIGTSASSCYFEDANRSVLWNDEFLTSANFNSLIINNSGTVFKATSCIFGFAPRSTSISSQFAPHTPKPGLTVNDSASAVLTSCTFNDFQASTLGPNTTCTDTIFRRCGAVTSNGATFTGGAFANQVTDGNINPTALVLTDSAGNPSQSTLQTLSNITFTSPGRGYAIDMGTISSNTAASIDLDNVKFPGYAAGSLGDNSGEIPPPTPNLGILITYNGTATFTINVVNGSDTPSLLNTGSGTVTLAAPPVNFAVTGLKDGTEVRLIDKEANEASNSTIAGVESVSNGSGTGIDAGGRSGASVAVTGAADDNTFTYSYQYSADDEILVAIISGSSFEIQYLEATLTASSQSIPIQQQDDRNALAVNEP